jgi:protein-serine/threonine kinase
VILFYFVPAQTPLCMYSTMLLLQSGSDDLVPGNNILINEDGSVQLCDFGVSGALEPDISKRSTIVGTPFWMAPELQNEWAKEADPSSRIKPKEILYGSEIDIWAFGCTIYEMATGFPPFHEKNIFKLPEAGVPSLEGDQYSDELKDLISFVLEPNPLDRPTPDQILEHPYIADTTKMYPTVSLVQLLERYYNWESAGGSRASLFNPYGAQAPDPLAPEDEAGEEDWTFSTTEEFAKHMSGIFPDPFAGNISENDFAFSQPPQDESRLAKLQASFREEQIDRGGKRLNRLFDQDSTPYRYSMLEPESGRPPSDLILRDFNPGAPNRETVIDLDFAAPTVVDVPSIDLGEVPTVKANRLNRLMREMEMEDEDQLLDMDQTDRRATREWKFPSMTEPEPEPMPEQDNRRTVDWKFPTMAEKSNRRTMEWTFDASMAESNAAQEPLPKLPRMPRRRDTQDLSLTTTNASVDQNRRTRDFVFPMRAPEEGDLSDLEFNFASSPTLSSGFRPTLRHATTEPMGSFNEYPQVKSAPESPVRFSMIDLDMANIDDYPRPSTSGSASTSTYTVGAENMNGNPFDLEDQVHLSQNNNRLSYHMKSQSEPNHAIPGLLTPQTTYDDQGVPTTQDPHHPAMHARGVSSVSQMQGKPPPNNITYRQRTQPSQPGWDGWNHHDAYHTDESSTPTSYSNSASPEDDQSVDELWDRLEQQSFAAPLRSGIRYPSGGYNRSRHAQSTSSDDDANYTSTDDYTTNIPTRLNVTTLHRQSRVSVGPNGRPLLEFPVPRGPDPEALLGVETDRGAMSTELLRATMEMRDGIRASRDLLRSMRLAEMRIDEE